MLEISGPRDVTLETSPLRRVSQVRVHSQHVVAVAGDALSPYIRSSSNASVTIRRALAGDDEVAGFVDVALLLASSNAHMPLKCMRAGDDKQPTAMLRRCVMGQ